MLFAASDLGVFQLSGNSWQLLDGSPHEARELLLNAFDARTGAFDLVARSTQGLYRTLGETWIALPTLDDTITKMLSVGTEEIQLDPAVTPGLYAFGENLYRLDGTSWTLIRQLSRTIVGAELFDEDGPGPAPNHLVFCDTLRTYRYVNGTPQIFGSFEGGVPQRLEVVHATESQRGQLWCSGTFDRVQDRSASCITYWPKYADRGDVDGNGAVALDDLALVLMNFGTTNDSYGDLNGDEDIDLEDLALVLSGFGTVCDE